MIRVEKRVRRGLGGGGVGGLERFEVDVGVVVVDRVSVVEGDGIDVVGWGERG